MPSSLPRLPRRAQPVVLIAAGVTLTTALAVIFILRDAGRRHRMKRGLEQVTVTFRKRQTRLGALNAAWGAMRGRIRRVAESKRDQDLKVQVLHALKTDRGVPSGLDVGVRGRTVYLQGAVADPATADNVVEKAHSVAGVRAVVNNITAAQ